MDSNQCRYQKSAVMRSRQTKTMYGGSRRNMGKERKRMYQTLSVSTRTLRETSPLGLSKLGSTLGSIERVFGLNIAARIGNCKVCRGTKNLRTFRAESVK